VKRDLGLTSPYATAICSMARTVRAVRSSPDGTVTEGGFHSFTDGSVRFYAPPGTVLLLVPSTQGANEFGELKGVLCA